MEESILLNEGPVVITPSRAVFGSTTYAIRNLTSVRGSSAKPSAVAAALAIIIGIGAIFANPFFGVPILAIGIFSMWKRKTVHAVVLATAGGETSAYESSDKAHVQRIINALNTALAGSHP